MFAVHADREAAAVRTFYSVTVEYKTLIDIFPMCGCSDRTSRKNFCARTAAYGCHVERGTELRAFEQHADRVVAHVAREGKGDEQIECYWLARADGAKGTIPAASPTHCNWG